MSNWNSKIKYNGKILKKMNKNCLGKYQNNKWSYMRMFNFFFQDRWELPPGICCLQQSMTLVNLLLRQTSVKMPVSISLLYSCNIKTCRWVCFFYLTAVTKYPDFKIIFNQTRLQFMSERKFIEINDMHGSHSVSIEDNKTQF